jgi:homoserine dehydrogenase
MRSIKLAMVGLGTVGTGVARLLSVHREHLRYQSGAYLDLKWVVVRDAAKSRAVDLSAARVVTDLTPVLEDSEVSVGIELVGGIDIAFDIISRLLKSGKHVVTANKAVLAARGRELFQLARDVGRSICFEAAVGGGIPIIAAISESLAANRITAVAGILNGTSNYILSAMHDDGLDYSDALAEARAKGFAEADPALDVDGTDAAQKLAILARLAFQSHVDAANIRRRGIADLRRADIRFAGELGYVIKLLAVAQAGDNRLRLRVGPTLVHRSSPMGQVRGEYNAIVVTGDAVGDTFYFGKGAGMMPTASSVVAEVLDLAIGRGQETFRSLRLWERNPPGPVFDPIDSLRGRFYLRYSVVDRPGVLAQIAGILGRHGISIASVIQHEISEDSVCEAVPLVIMTHLAEESAVEAAITESDGLDVVREQTVSMYVAN